jgi:putative transposase
MPRTARASVGGYCYHVINRGNARSVVFHADGDYQAFMDLLSQASQRIPMRVLAYCLMPNHFHLALWPSHDGELSRWMQWLLTAHVRRYHRWHDSSGHVWQGRFKAFPIEQDDHLLAVLRYIELNPVRANLVYEPKTGGGRVPVRGENPCEALVWKPDPWHGQSRGSIG